MEAGCLVNAPEDALAGMILAEHEDISDDALIAKAAEALRPYVPTGNGWLNASTNALFEGNCHKAAVAVVEAVRNQIAAEALREAERAESINFMVTTAQLMNRADRLDPKETP